jgi:hypothetical protein
VFWVAYFARDYATHFDTRVIYTSNPALPYQQEDFLLRHRSSQFRLDEETYDLSEQWDNDGFVLWGVDRHRTFEAPHVRYPVEAELGGKVRLLGFNANFEDLRVGDTLNLVLYWQALDSMVESYKVFVHLIDEGGQMAGQVDGIPVHWTYPTDWWEPREIVEDKYDVLIDGDVPLGDCSLQVGMYIEGGERLPVTVDGVPDPLRRVVLWESISLLPRRREPSD